MRIKQEGKKCVYTFDRNKGINILWNLFTKFVNGMVIFMKYVFVFKYPYSLIYIIYKHNFVKMILHRFWFLFWILMRHIFLHARSITRT